MKFSSLFWLFPIVSLGLVHCSGSSNEGTNTPDSSTSDTSNSSDGSLQDGSHNDSQVPNDTSSNDAMNDSATDGGGDTSRCNMSAENTDGVFVAKNGVDGLTCGTKEAPCATLKQAVERAKTNPKKTVFVAAGEYDENGLVIPSDVTVQGGLFETGPASFPGATAWKRACPLNPTLVVVKSTNAPVVVSVNSNAKVTLDTLTIKSKPTAALGESLYGLQALGVQTQVNLRDVSIQVAKGGDGSSPTSGLAGSTGNETCPIASTGAAGTQGTNGTKGTIGQFANGFYIPGDGIPGTDGMTGENGTASQGDCVSTDRNQKYPTSCGLDRKGKNCVEGDFRTACAEDGKPGCGGGGGKGGSAGKGGGSSVGIIAAQGAKVFTQGGEVKVSDGGKGNNGGAGGAGGDGGKGINASTTLVSYITSCVDTDPDPDIAMCNSTSDFVTLSGGLGGLGGKGGSGGQGGGGSGGFSVAIAKTEGATVTISNNSTKLTIGTGGLGGNGSDGQAPNGVAVEQWPNP